MNISGSVSNRPVPVAVKTTEQHKIGESAAPSSPAQHYQHAQNTSSILNLDNGTRKQLEIKEKSIERTIVIRELNESPKDTSSQNMQSLTYNELFHRPNNTSDSVSPIVTNRAKSAYQKQTSNDIDQHGSLNISI